MMDARPIYVYSPDWVRAYALMALCAVPTLNEVPLGFHTSAHLLAHVDAAPPAFLLLALRPHEHVVLLHALRLRAPDCVLIVVSPHFYHSDRMIAHHLGQMTLVTDDAAMAAYPHYTPLDWVRCASLSQPLSVRAPSPQRALTPSDIAVGVNAYLRDSLSRYGLTPKERAMVQRGFACGRPIAWIARRFGVKAKTVYTHRENIMRRLGVVSLPRTSALALLRSLRVSLAWQYVVMDAHEDTPALKGGQEVSWGDAIEVCAPSLPPLINGASCLRSMPACGSLHHAMAVGGCGCTSFIAPPE